MNGGLHIRAGGGRTKQRVNIMADWTTDANDALRLSFGPSSVSVSAPANIYQCHMLTQTSSFIRLSLIPSMARTRRYTVTLTFSLTYVLSLLLCHFTHPCHKLKFASGSLSQYLNISYSKKLPSSTVDDVQGTLAKFIPTGYYEDEAAFLRQVDEDTLSFRPHGDLICSYTCPPAEGKDAVEFEMYHVRILFPVSEKHKPHYFSLRGILPASKSTIDDSNSLFCYT